MVMWFLTGYIMIFSGFPKVEREHTLSLLESLEADTLLPSYTTVYEWYKKQGGNDKLSSFILERQDGQTRLIIRDESGKKFILDALSGEKIRPTAPTKEDLFAKVALLTNSPIDHIDTLTQLNQWIPFSQRRGDLPFYKVVLSDDAESHYYFSGTTGQLLQETTKYNRWMAYLGAIPHWIYIWQIRQDLELWINILIVLGVIGCIVCITGLVLGVYRTYQSRKRPKKHWSPYRNVWYRWHHISGLIFGCFVLTWIFSGWMSVDKLPTWMTGDPPREAFYHLRSTPMDSLNTTAPVGDLMSLNKNVKRVTVSSFMGQLCVKVEKENNATEYWGYSEGKYHPFETTEEMAVKTIRTMIPDAQITGVQQIENYTEEYLPHPRGKHPPALPALSIQTEEGTTLYVAIYKPELIVTNNETIANGWAYKKLHSLKFLWAYHHPNIWLAVMLLLLSGGSIVSITGLVLGIKVLRRPRQNKNKR